MNTKREYPTLTLDPEALHQLERLLNLGSALAAHGQRYGRSHVIKYEISPAWIKQLEHVRPWLKGCFSLWKGCHHDPRATY